MIPREFDYVCPSSLEEVFAALRAQPEDAKLLAGGHSLLPLMKLRLASPALLVDLSGVPGLRGVRDDGDFLTVGAMTTYIDVIDDPLVRRHCRPLAEVAGCVGDPQVRHRGTIGGAIAHGDGAGDVPTLALALEAELVIQGPSGTRVVSASDFFIGWFQTALAEDEIITAIRRVNAGERYIAAEIARQLALQAVNRSNSSGSPFEQLSAREMQVMIMATKGHSVQDISDKLHLSPKTVSTYRSRLFEKLGVANDVELTRLAMRYGVIEEKTSGTGAS